LKIRTVENLTGDRDRMDDEKVYDSSKPLVLIVEDNAVNSTFCQSLLRKNGYETAVCSDGETALDFIGKYIPDLILLDIVMPGIDGYELSLKLKTNDKLKDTPVIFLSAMNDEESIIKGFNSGGVDFITKPFRTQELLARTKTHIELKNTKERLMQMAITDELTGLVNRRYFLERLHYEFDRMKRYDTIYSMLMVDIDHFKKINDTYGHKAGDIVLKKASEAMKKSLRTSDIIGRFGGEEFAALLPEADIKSASFIAERLRKKVEEVNIEYESAKISLTISIGASQSNITDTKIDEIIIRSDTAMYHSKKEGRNRVSLS